MRDIFSGVHLGDSSMWLHVLRVHACLAATLTISLIAVFWLARSHVADHKHSLCRISSAGLLVCGHLQFWGSASRGRMLVTVNLDLLHIACPCLHAELSRAVVERAGSIYCMGSACALGGRLFGDTCSWGQALICTLYPACASNSSWLRG